VVPFALAGGGVPIGVILLPVLVPVALLGAMLLLTRRNLGSRLPSRVSVTDRRVIVENFGKGSLSTSARLDNLGDVKVEAGRAARASGVAWVYFLPLGTTQAMIGSGRYRMAAPGVIWAPSMPLSQAEELQRFTLAQARAVQAAENAAATAAARAR
jgi:hypothetical protein